MSQNLQWITLDSCITDYLNQSEQDIHKYWKLFHLAFRGMDDMGMDFFYTVRSYKIPVNSNLTVTIPANCIRVSKVGVFNQQGDVIPLAVNNNLSTAFDLSPNRLQQTQDDTIPTQINQQGVWWYNYWNGQSFGNLYGLPSGNPLIGSYKIDNQNGVIVLSENFTYEYILLECIASPAEGETYVVPIQFREAMIAWLDWKDSTAKVMRTHMQLGSSRDKEKIYYNERRKAIAKYDPINLKDLYEWNLTNQRITVKS